MEHAEIDVNDPDFWKKVLPDLVTPDIMFERLSDESLCEDEVRTYVCNTMLQLCKRGSRKLQIDFHNKSLFMGSKEKRNYGFFYDVKAKTRTF